MNKLFTGLFILLAFFNTSCADEAKPSTILEIDNAWIAEAPPVSKVMVAYMTIINRSAEEVVIIRAESDLYSSIELHETIHEDGMARMIRYEEIRVPAMGQVELKRGAKHLMLFNPVKPLKAGETANIKFITKNNREQTIAVPVIKAQY